MKTIQQVQQEKEEMNTEIVNSVRKFMNNNPDIVPDIEVSIRTGILHNGDKILLSIQAKSTVRI